MLNYLQSVKREFSNIRWLKVGRAISLTFLVLLASVAVGFLIKAIDSGILFILGSFV